MIFGNKMVHIAFDAVVLQSGVDNVLHIGGQLQLGPCLSEQQGDDEHDRQPERF